MHTPLPSIEPLETRIAPAGLVTITFAGGKLVIEGDSESNDLSIRPANVGTFAISGLDGTMLAVNGQAPVSETELEGTLRSLTARLGAGDDEMVIAGISIEGDVLIDGGEGDDTIALEGVSTRGALDLRGGSGGDTISIVSAGARFGSIRVDLGQGDDTFTATGTAASVAGPFTILGGPGDDTISVGVSSLKVRGAATFDGGDGVNQNVLSALIADIGGPLRLLQGSHSTGTAVTVLGAAFGNLRGGVLIEVGDGDHQITGSFSNDVSIAKRVDIRSGNGDDSVTFSQGSVRLLGGLSLDLGDGDNTATIAIAQKVARLSYAGGSGADSVSISGAGDIQIAGLLRFAPGDGANTLAMSGNTITIGSLAVFGGLGDDTFAVSSTSLQVDGKSDLRLGDGSNVTDISTSVARLGGPLTITGGAGPDNATIDTITLFSKGGVRFDGGAGGPDSFGFGVSAAEILGSLQARTPDAPGMASSIALSLGFTTITKNITAQAGAGNAGISIGASNDFFVGGRIDLRGAGEGDKTFTIATTIMTVLGGIQIGGGSGVNSATVSGASALLGSLSYTGGAGVDTFVANLGGSITGPMRLDMGTGNNTAQITGNSLTTALSLARGLDFRSDAPAASTDTVNLANVIIRGKTSITMGNGASNVSIENFVMDSLALDTAGGADVVEIETAASGRASVFNGSVRILLGDGDDALTIGDNSDQAKADFRKRVLIDGGDGTDTFDDNGNLYIAGQPIVQNIP
jgi:hypothetical protein